MPPAGCATVFEARRYRCRERARRVLSDCWHADLGKRPVGRATYKRIQDAPRMLLLGDSCGNPSTRPSGVHRGVSIGWPSMMARMAGLRLGERCSDRHGAHAEHHRPGERQGGIGAFLG